MAIGCGHQPAAFGGVQHFRHGEHADGCAFYAGHGLFAARRQGGLRPEQATRAVAIADAFEASPERAQVGRGVVAIIVAAVAGGVGSMGSSVHLDFLGSRADAPPRGCGWRTVHGCKPGRQIAIYRRVQRPPRTARRKGRRIARRHGPETVPTGERKQHAICLPGLAGPVPPVVGGAACWLRPRLEFNRSFPKGLRGPRAKRECRRHV